MHKLSAVSLAVATIVAAAAFPALAQDAEQTTLERVVVTGTAIKRLDAESSVPVTTFKMNEIREAGLTTVEQILSTLTASQASLGTSQSVGSSTGGASFADMRGVGANKTLVLLNGRRIANNAFDGSAPDLNMIPLAAIERIEVLRDGASSLYGTDAIGGVINFITKKDYTGGSVNIGYESPQHAGGKSGNFNIGYGYGDLDQQGFNVFGFVDYQQQDNIAGDQRNYNQRYAGGLSTNTDPANYYQGSGLTVYNPAAPDCTNGTNLIKAGTFCRMTTSSYVDYVPKSERSSGMLKGTLKLNADHQLGAEYFITRSVVETRLAPTPYGALSMQPGNVFFPTNPALDPTLPLTVKWRDTVSGPREDKNTNLQQRYLLTLDGVIAGWDYSSGLSYNQNRVSEKLTGGYADGSKIAAGVTNGIINPFGNQSDDAIQYIRNAAALGTLMNGKGETYNFDAHASRELGDWFGAGRAAGIAVGTEFRKEKFSQKANKDYATLVFDSTGVDPQTYSVGTRKVYAVYTELNVPLHKTLDVTAAVRYDKYNDFGNTTNPKVSFRFQPNKEILVRGSLSTGFRAPSLYELHAANTFTNTGTVSDPVLCPGGVGAGINCDTQFTAMNGGNAELKPEKSKSGTLGFQFAPTTDLSFGVDFWWIRVKNLIGTIGEASLYDPANYQQFSEYFHRNADGQLSQATNVCPGPTCGYVDVRQRNLGGNNTNGFDLTGNYRVRTGFGTLTFGLNSTYVTKYEYQEYQNGPWIQNVGKYSGAGPVFRWQHNVNAVWSYASKYSVGLTGHYKSSYRDDPNGDDSNIVASYTTWDLYGTYKPVKTLSLTAGVRNLFDRDPPLSFQQAVFQAGYDPRFTDPTGRTFYVRGSYEF
ncbi:TonB-dependent receptor [Roseateles depolymerans]|uniref:TonB-dependent Receptor Plug domain protein n=1 Tax=Roseateles depolymerans TaxID=76731 RepID=A0A0U3MKP8_9BURK|nr:TonB-dependent receptor [Roseateles depolymerans]ALV09065.1 TonB-dependent Receptor Plug domain protein [Roseateles depolymerans]REG10147.1 iron complex outermembrane receptor protein [Roseateles depolymerans]